MRQPSFSTVHLDYLQRTTVSPPDATRIASLTRASAPHRRLCHVRGIGRSEKLILPQPGEPPRFPSADLLVGLSGYRIPFAFHLTEGGDGVAVHVGTWCPDQLGTPREVLDARQQIVEGLLRSLYPSVRLGPATAEMEPAARGGFVLGVPTATPADAVDGALPLDRVIRALAGSSWSCLILAQPVEEAAIAGLLHGVINEMRAALSEAEDMHAPSPLAKHYGELLQMAVTNLTRGQAVGLWRTGVYLLGDERSYYRLAATWRGVFGGDQSLPEPVRTFDAASVPALAAAWALPDVVGTPGPGHYRHPQEYQTLLTSSQLAACAHLPHVETTGFSVNIVPEFDKVPPEVRGDGTIQIGSVIEQGHSRTAAYRVEPRSLARHALVAGVTGSGKTNTIFHLLQQAGSTVPFLVLEPAKTEYRALLQDARVGALQVFTPGNETVAPFRLNPFQVVGWPRTPVGVHLDLLRSVFAVSFGMWTPLPQVLEKCLHRIYEARGWDITTNTNRRLRDGGDPTTAFPTLSDLFSTVEEVANELGYEERITADVRAALRTRIDALRTGGKGTMLDVQRSLPFELVLERPTILELEGMGDDDDKAFLMGLLLICLAEYRRTQGEARQLRHVLVIEEAHRLLANVGGRGREEESDPRGKAVETFANLLSEIRAYGQGVVIADQIPVKLAPDVVKNTNLKIAHRVVAQDDRVTLAGAMAMNERQARALTTLGRGEAAVFAEGDDAPVLVAVPPARGDDERPSVDDAAVRASWERMRESGELEGFFLPYETCASSCVPPNQGCAAVRRLVDDGPVRAATAALVLSLVSAAADGEGALADVLCDSAAVLAGALDSRLPAPAGDRASDIRCAVTHAIRRHLHQRGEDYGWPQGEVFRLASMILPALTDVGGGGVRRRESMADLVKFCRAFAALSAVPAAPFFGCARACPGKTRTCLYRYDAASVVASRDFDADYRHAGWDAQELVNLAARGANRLLAPMAGTQAKRRAALCLLLQKIDRDERLSPIARRNLADDVLELWPDETSGKAAPSRLAAPGD